MKSIKLNIGGMTCVNCQNTIQRGLSGTAGVQSVTVRYDTGVASVTFDPELITEAGLAAVVTDLGYSVGRKSAVGRIVGLLLVIIILYALLSRTGLLNRLVPSRLADVSMGYGMLFVIGLLTSVHCIAMCGGINLSQSIVGGKMPALLYNLGRVASYTLVGFIVGAIGSAIALTPMLQGVLKLIAGLFMIALGFRMIGIFPWLRRLSFSVFKINVGNKGPLIVGLLNGLMPCGPLQAMQIYALSTGSAVAGAVSMFIFSLGTVPLMLGLGAISTALGRRATTKIMTVGAVLVVVLGLSMLSQGYSLAGLPRPWLNNTEGTRAQMTDDGTQLVDTVLSSSEYPNIIVQAGVPVRWRINAPQGSINGCNNRMFINEYDIEYSFHTGENIIEFTPNTAGTLQYSCWMGMIHGTIIIEE